MMGLSLAAAGVSGIPWGWILAVGIGGFIGLAMYMSRYDPLDFGGSTAGCFGTILTGILGAVLGEVILDRLFDVQIQDFVGVVLTAVIGGGLLVSLVAALQGRGRRESRH